jgi:hypothetical protein
LVHFNHGTIYRNSKLSSHLVWYESSQCLQVLWKWVCASNGFGTWRSWIAMVLILNYVSDGVQKRQLPYLWMVYYDLHNQNMFGSSMLTPLSLNAQIWKTKHSLSHSSQAKVHCCFRVLFKVGSPTLNTFCQSNIYKEPLCWNEERAMISFRFSL